MLEKSSQEGMNKIVLRQLKNQLEDAEFARTAALKAKANTELELVEVNSMLEDTTRVKTELEEKLVKVYSELILVYIYLCLTIAGWAREIRCGPAVAGDGGGGESRACFHLTDCPVL